MGVGDQSNQAWDNYPKNQIQYLISSAVQASQQAMFSHCGIYWEFCKVHCKFLGVSSQCSKLF